MTNAKTKKRIMKGAMLFALVFMLLSGIAAHALAAVSMEAENSYTPNFAFDYKDVLTAPVAVNTGDGTYYTPTSYIYYGRRYDSVNQCYIPILHRVLDPNADNAGADGAIFLLAEGVGYSSRFSPYTDDEVAGYLGDENAYLGSTLVQKLYSAQYTVYEIPYVNTGTVDSLPQELDYIRPITKSDSMAAMDGYFGFTKGLGEYYWSVVDADGNEVDSLNLLDSSRVFPLSAEELYQYVGTSSFTNASAQTVFIATDVIDGTSRSWWLRSALADGAKTGAMVGAVDSNGKVTFISAQNTLATRNALNLETSDIAFLELVSENSYRIAFKAPEYKEGAPIEATLADVKGNVVTFRVKNHFGKTSWQSDGENRISFIITDSEGNEKYYGKAGESKVNSIFGERVTEEETFTLTLPACYESGDKVQVFWERIDDPDRISTSYVSNFVDLGCIHIPEEGREANCQSPAFCSICERSYGELDEDHHRDIATVWTYNEGEGTHSRSCLFCNAKVYTEACNFGPYNLTSPRACYESSCNDCEHKVDDPSYHQYDEMGICRDTDGEIHYEMPEIQNDINLGFETTINTAGEWNALAEWLNRGGYFLRVGETKYIILGSDLDFSDIPFIPMGTVDTPVTNLTIRGGHRIISNIEYSANGDAPAGIIAVGEKIRVDDLIVRDCSFDGSESGAIVGRLIDTVENASVFDGIAITDVNLLGTKVGGVVGTLTEKATLSLSFIYNVNQNEQHLDFSYDGKLTPTPADVNEGVPYGGCYRLASEGDGVFAFTQEAFASGEITYRLRQIDPYWRQTIGKHSYPIYCKDESVKRVYRVISCNGEDVSYYNEDLGQIQHGSYTSVIPSTFEWVDGVGDFGVGFSVDVVCGLCDEATEVILEADWTPYYTYSGRYIARMEFNAYVEIAGDNVKVNETSKVIYSHYLEDFIGMTPITVTYNGQGYSADPLFDNLRDGISYPDDFSAYFLDPATGERITWLEYDYYGKPTYIPAGVTNVGTYDVLIVGKRGFEGYEYLYEDVFTIEKAKVTVDPLNVQKVVDGTKVFEVEYNLEGDVIWDLEFDISLENAPSEKAGAYTLNVIADLTSHTHGDNIEIILLRDTVTAVILPDLRISLSNKSYPESIVYGENVPAVTAEYFNISADATISYSWFTAGHDFYDGYYPQRAVDAPTDAGMYILRVYAMSKDSTLIGQSLDIEFEVVKRSLTVNLYAPSGARTEDRYGSTYYLIDPGEAFRYEAVGFVNGETLESLGLQMEINLYSAHSGSLEGSSVGNPQFPQANDYQVSYYLPINRNYEVTKYVIHAGETSQESEYGNLYISINNPGYVYPVETEFAADGEAISTNLLISVAPMAGIAPNGSEFNYTIKVFNSDGIEVLKKESSATALDKVYLYDHTFTESWSGGYTFTRGAFAAEGEYSVKVEINGAGVNATYETTFTLQFFNDADEGIAEIVEPGIYTVKVINEDGTTREANLYAQQKLTMNLKPHEYDLSEGRLEYDPAKVIMEAGNVIHLNHTLVEVYFYINESQGKAYVDGVKVVDQNGNDVSRLYSVEHETLSWPSHSDKLNICHIFDNPCDYNCNISGCEYVRAISHTGGEATCMQQAVCENCGISYGEYSSERHLVESVIVFPNVSAPEESHLLVYACCGGTKEVVAHTHTIPATCTVRASCSECGWEYGDLDPTNHSSEECAYTPDGETHKVTHLCCGAVDSEAHSGGTAYCNAKPVCALCDASYGEIDPENHAENIQYIPDVNDSMRHNEVYPCCGKSVSYTHSGGDATCIAAAVCEYCKASYGEPELNDHASESFAYKQDMDNPSLHLIHHACCDLFIEKDYHGGGVANCQSPALCSYCNTPYGEKDYRTHASEEYACYPDPDHADMHINVAACCGEFAGKEEHSYADATCTHPSRCACGLERGEPIDHSYDNDCDSVCNVCEEETRAKSFHIGKDGKPCEICGEMIPQKPISGGGISAIVTASTVVASAGGFSLFWFVIKKKSFAELLALILK